MQAPVVVTNLLAAKRGECLPRVYDGYGSCPLTVAYGKIILAEFCYGGKVTPSFPLDPRRPRTSMWYLKTKFLPWLYMSHMFSGSEIDIPHKERHFA
jgi:sulfide:quinone oxidoreductase